jgi:hypothetical protein
MYRPNAEHPQSFMRNAGISYLGATPQTMGDQWWFWGCTNAPDPLPRHLSLLVASPLDWIGCGISREDAELIELEQMGNKEC